VTIGALARRAGVSRAAFYEHFADKEACLLAAYDHFAAALLSAMTADLEPDTSWSAFIDSTLAGYIGMLDADPIAARAFVLEMDGAGPAARRRRREAAQLFASLIAQRHAAMRERDPALGPLPERVYLGIALGVRQLIQDALEEDPGPQLSGLAADIRLWIAAVVAGASAAGDA
jgi:AcrR family transcriptional regulator